MQSFNEFFKDFIAEKIKNDPEFAKKIQDDPDEMQKIKDEFFDEIHPY